MKRIGDLLGFAICFTATPVFCQSPATSRPGAQQLVESSTPLMECELQDIFVAPGGTALLDVYVSNVLPDLVRGYQTQISIVQPSGGGTANVPCPCPCPPASHSDGGVRIDDSRVDFVFAGDSGIVSAVNCITLKALSSKLSGGAAVGASRAFLSEYEVAVSSDAVPGTQFQISLLPPNGSLLVGPSSNQIGFGIGPPCVLTVATPPNPPVVSFQLVAAASPTSVESATSLPTSVHAFRQHETYFVEVWAQTNDPHGLQSASINLNFNSSLTHAMQIMPTNVFSEFRSGILENQLGRVRDLSGSHVLVSPPCSGQVAVAPGWARLATVSLSADAVGLVSISTGPASSPFLGTANCGQLGDVSPSNIDFQEIHLSVIPDTGVPAISEWGLVVMGLLTVIAGTIGLCVRNANLNRQKS